MSQAHLQVRALVHDTAEHQGGKGDSPVHQVPDGVGKVVAAGPRAYQCLSSLVDKDEGTHLLCCLPEGKQLQLIECPSMQE